MPIGEFGKAPPLAAEGSPALTTPMYWMYEMAHASLNPARAISDATKLLFQNPLTAKLFRQQWLDAGVPADKIEGANLADARTIKQAVTVPVICTGGFQTASVIRSAITSGSCDAVSGARTLVANNDLVKHFAAGRDRAPKPCTYCNKCLAHVVEHPLGCYEESRFSSREEMLAQIMSVFQPSAFA